MIAGFDFPQNGVDPKKRRRTGVNMRDLLLKLTQIDICLEVLNLNGQLDGITQIGIASTAESSERLKMSSCTPAVFKFPAFFELASIELRQVEPNFGVVWYLLYRSTEMRLKNDFGFGDFKIEEFEFAFKMPTSALLNQGF